MGIPEGEVPIFNKDEQLMRKITFANIKAMSDNNSL